MKALILLIGTLFCIIVSSHPICQSGNYPLVPLHSLLVCTEWNDESCYDVAREQQVVAAYVTENVQLFSLGFQLNNKSSWTACDANLIKVGCLKCSPLEGHLYENVSSTEPLVCLGWCNSTLLPACGADRVSYTGSYASESIYCYNKTLPEFIPSTQGLVDAFPGIKVAGITAFVSAPNDPIGYYISTKDGKVIRIQPNGQNWGEQTPLLDITTVTETGGEQGLLSIHFDHTYGNTTCYLWAWYSELRPNVEQRNKLVRFWVDNCQDTTNFGQHKVQNINEECTMFVVPKQSQWHNGGTILQDSVGDIYVGHGDGGQQNDGNEDALNPFNYRGKIMRIRPAYPAAPNQRRCASQSDKYTIPPGNYYSSLSEGLLEIYVMGLRNPWNAKMEQPGDRFYLSDVGQNSYEELNRVFLNSTRRNGGYPGYEGGSILKSNAASRVDAEGRLLWPLFDYRHESNMAPTNITIPNIFGNSISYCGIYHGNILPEKWRDGNTHIVADYMEFAIFAINVNKETGSIFGEPLIFNTPPIIRSGNTREGEMIFIPFAYSTPVTLLKFAPFQLQQSLCGNYICEIGESCTNCLIDCPGRLTGPNSRQYCCGDGVLIQGVASSLPPGVTCTGRTPSTVAIAGNGYCEPGENCVISPDCIGHKGPGVGSDNDWCCHGTKEGPVCVSPYGDLPLTNVTIDSPACLATNDPCHKGNKGTGNGVIYEF